MHSRRAFITAGLAAVALAAVAIPDRALATAGLDFKPNVTSMVHVYRNGVDGLVKVGEFNVGQKMILSDGVDQAYVVINDTAGDFSITIPDGHMLVRHDRAAFVDGLFVVPGAEQLRVFYRDKVYAPKHAAMQPDNGAGQVSGDRAQSVGKAGDLKADRPGGVQSGTPGAKAVDARKQSWIGRAFRRFISPAYS